MKNFIFALLIGITVSFSPNMEEELGVAKEGDCEYRKLCPACGASYYCPYFEARTRHCCDGAACTPGLVYDCPLCPSSLSRDNNLCWSSNCATGGGGRCPDDPPCEKDFRDGTFDCCEFGCYTRGNSFNGECYPF